MATSLTTMTKTVTLWFTKTNLSALQTLLKDSKIKHGPFNKSPLNRQGERHYWVDLHTCTDATKTYFLLSGLIYNISEE